MHHKREKEHQKLSPFFSSNCTEVDRIMGPFHFGLQRLIFATPDLLDHYSAFTLRSYRTVQYFGGGIEKSHILKASKGN